MCLQRVCEGGWESGGCEAESGIMLKKWRKGCVGCVVCMYEGGGMCLRCEREWRVVVYGCGCGMREWRAGSGCEREESGCV